MGMLGDSWDDPKSLATLQLAAGLLGPGGFGTGLSRGLLGYQNALTEAQKRDFVKAQEADTLQQVALRNIQAKQAQRQFDWQNSIFESLAGNSQSPASSALEQGATVGSVGPTTANASRMDAAPAGSFFGVPTNVARAVAATSGLNQLGQTITQYNSPTDFLKTLAASGIDPSGPLGRQLIQTQVAKQNYQAPVNARPGSIMRDPFDPTKVLAVNPTLPAATLPTFDANGNVNGLNLIPGAAAAEQTTSYAKASGRAATEPVTGYAAGSNTPTFTNKLEAAGGSRIVNPNLGGAQNAGAPYSGVSATALPETLLVFQEERAKAPPGPDRDALDREIKRIQNAMLTNRQSSAGPSTSGPLMPAPALGAQRAADKSAEDAVENYNSMHTFAQGAQRNIGLLQTIQQLADKTLVGPGSSKVQFVNGVLNTLGIRPGEDNAQNYQLMKKNLGMLVGSQRMGATGGGSDALQRLLEGSNPNVAEMNAPALKEASEELIAFNRMLMAKDRSLPNPAQVPAAQFQQAETAFAPFADPRLWQLEHAASDKERARILSLMPAIERAAILEKAKKAREAGLFQ